MTGANANTRERLVNAATEYDRKALAADQRVRAAGKLGTYSPGEIDTYLVGIGNALRDVASTTLREALCKAFSRRGLQRVLDSLLRAIGESPSTRDEQYWRW